MDIVKINVEETRYLPEVLELASLGKAAKLAGVPQSEIINHLAALKIPLARYGADELARKVAAFA